MCVASELAERLHAELACVDLDAGDPSRRLLRAAHATGCDLVVVGYASRSGIGTTLPPGWQWRVVRDTPSPVMLMPADAVPTRDGRIMLGYDMPELPHQAAKAAGRLAERLRTPLIITDVLAGDRTRRATDWQLYDSARVLAWKEEDTAGGTLTVRPAEREQRTSDQLVCAAAILEAALVVIAGRRRGRGLVPRRSVARRLHGSGRMPVIVAAS
jgi:Universal stress protein family